MRFDDDDDGRREQRDSRQRAFQLRTSLGNDLRCHVGLCSTRVEDWRLEQYSEAIASRDDLKTVRFKSEEAMGRRWVEARIMNVGSMRAVLWYESGPL